MRALLPRAEPDVDVHEHYARDWAATGGWRANMVASVDGASALAGKSGGLQTDGDNAVFAALRDLADVVLVGASTVEQEDYGPVRLDEAAVARRARHGLGDRLRIAVVTRSLRLDPSSRLLATSQPANRPLVITCTAADPDRRTALAGVAEIVDCGTDDIDYAAVRRELSGRGLTRVLCEGGPTILGRVAASGELDELCLSVVPRLAGPGAARILAGEAWPGDAAALELTGLLEEDGALFLRYRTA